MSDKSWGQKLWERTKIYDWLENRKLKNDAKAEAQKEFYSSDEYKKTVKERIVAKEKAESEKPSIGDKLVGMGAKVANNLANMELGTGAMIDESTAKNSRGGKVGKKQKKESEQERLARMLR